MASSSTDIGESSDIIHEYSCKPCGDDGKNIEGMNFCSECQTYFCHACIKFHNKCFKTHTIFNKCGVKSGKIQSEQQQEGQMCEKHAGYLIQMYCGEHDIVCCAVCIAVDHRLCKAVDFIPKLAREILNGRERKDVKISLEKNQEQLQAMKVCKLEQIKEVRKEKEKHIKEITKMKEYVIARVEEIGLNSVKQVEDKHDRIVRSINTDIECIDENLNVIESSIDNINKFKGNNEAKLFVVLNKAHEVEVGSSSYIRKNGDARYDSINFEINLNIASFVSKVDVFGIVKSDDGRAIAETDIPISEASLVKQMSVGQVYDSCVLDNGQIIVVVNDGLKRLDKTYKLLDEHDVLGAYKVCKVGPTVIAVLCRGYSSTVTFVDAGKSFHVTRSFTIPKDKGIYPMINGRYVSTIYYTGISHVNRKLYLFVKLIYEESNRIKIGISFYDLKGNYIETCIVPTDYDPSEKIRHVTCSQYDSSIYITYSKGLLVFDMSSKKVKNITHEKLRNPCYVCEGKKDQLFVCGKESQNVFLLDRVKNTVEEILGTIDGLTDPWHLMYIQQENQLLVIDDYSDIKVYQLN